MVSGHIAFSFCIEQDLNFDWNLCVALFLDIQLVLVCNDIPVVGVIK